MAIAYKLFSLHKNRQGQLFPLFVNANEATPMNEWVKAECGDRNDNGKVKSKLGPLCYRPGWHLSDIPIATHIGIKDDSGKVAFMRPDMVWCECEYSDVVEYQDEANKRGMVNGKLVPKLAYLDYIPEDGYYRYKTNPNMMGTWILSGAIKVNRVMTDAEVDAMLLEHGVKPMPRYGGAIDLAAYGF